MQKFILTMIIPTFFHMGIILAEPLDGLIDSIDVIDPTLNGIGFATRYSEPSYVCHVKGYPIAEIIEQHLVKKNGCYSTEIIGNDGIDPNRAGAMFIINKYDGDCDVIKRVRCSRRR